MKNKIKKICPRGFVIARLFTMVIRECKSQCTLAPFDIGRIISTDHCNTMFRILFTRRTFIYHFQQKYIF